VSDYCINTSNILIKNKQRDLFSCNDLLRVGHETKIFTQL